MILLASRDVPPGRCQRTFRHGRLGPLVLALAFLAPFGIAWVLRSELLELARSLPWFAWLVVGPVALAGSALLLLIVLSCASAVLSSFAPSNWIAKLADDGLYLQFRSHLNRHFPADDPTVVHLTFGEIARVVAVRERSEVSSERGQRITVRRFVDLELAGVDTAPLARAVDLERTRKAPERTFLGIRSRSRYVHVPVFVPEPGRIRVERVGGLLKALGAQVEHGEPRRVALAAPAAGPLEARLRELVVRGQILDAVELARGERGLPLGAARELVREVERAA